MERPHKEELRQVGLFGRMSISEPEERSHFDEFRFYRFGFKMGLANLLRNRMRLGLKKTVGKITQPVNSYTRFPEYALMDEAIRSFSQRKGSSEALRVLDVGSPKCFGLYLASTMNLEVEMTDISPLNVDEYRAIWGAVSTQARGSARFALQDARSLRYAANQFDVVYAMSVLEHIEGETGDADGVREMVRVLKPKGLLLFSVPFGLNYVEQKRRGFARAVEKTRDKSLYFFQRIYNRSSFERRVSPAMEGLQVRAQWTVWRESQLSLRLFTCLGENLQGLLGFVNPWLSRWVNRSTDGLVDQIPSSYGEVLSAADLYGDAVIIAEKEAP